MLPPVVRVSFLSPELGEGSSNEVRWLTGGPPWLIVDCLVRALGSRVAGASSPCFLRSFLDTSPPQGRFRYHGARLQPRITHPALHNRLHLALSDECLRQAGGNASEKL